MLKLSQETLLIATRYWAGQFGCAPEKLFAEPLRILEHGEALANNNGVLALFREAAVVVSASRDRVATVRELLSAVSPDCAADSFVSALGPISRTVIGPAYIGYATTISQQPDLARMLGPDDASAVEVLQSSCDSAEWEHGGSSLDNPCSGVFVDGRLAALAGYEVWGAAIAHISIITRPDCRGRGFGRGAVAHLANLALERRLVPQYRSLESNRASTRVAKSLGFVRYATSVAVKLDDAVL